MWDIDYALRQAYNVCVSGHNGRGITGKGFMMRASSLSALLMLLLIAAVFVLLTLIVVAAIASGYFEFVFDNWEW